MRLLNYTVQPAAIVCVSILCASASADEATLCNAHEEVYFSCHVGNKVVSVCASGNISPKNGYVQYRFGNIGGIEFEYPELPVPPEKKFYIIDINAGNVQSTHLKFKSGGYDYVIYSGFPSGVYVKKRGKVVLNRVCDSGIYTSLSSRIFRGVPNVPPASNNDD